MHEMITEIRQPHDVQANRFHPSGSFSEFSKEEVEQSIPTRFEKIASKHAGRIAVKTPNDVLTYAELNAMANRVARAIRTRGGDKAESIGLLLENGTQLAAAMLGVLKAGKFFTLLDPTFPKARIISMLEDSEAPLVVINRQAASLAREIENDGCRFLELESVNISISDADLRLHASPKAFACIVYTSGSTGQPKGVVWDHRDLLHRIMLRTKENNPCEHDRIALLPAGTANAVTNIFFALLNGAQLLTFDVQNEGVARLAGWLLRERISICPISSPLFRNLCETLTGEERFPDLRVIRLRSETVYKTDVDLYKKYFSPNCTFLTGLSTSETGQLTTYLINHDTEIAGSEVPVGYAVEDKEILLLDETGNEVGINEVGEITVRSDYLSPDYWRRPELAKAKFRPDPQGSEKRLCLTGDLGLMLPDGCLIHKGRKDFRVKVRGYGVETAEVEKTLRDHAAIRDAVVVARENELGEARLVAYFTSSSQPYPSAGELRGFLKKKLPDYMIPSAFVVMDTIPLTSNGKVDRRSLPDPKKSRPELDTPFSAPRTPQEERLVGIWAEALGFDRIGIHDNFFDLGGHSLLATRVISRVRGEFQVELSLGRFFETPTIAGLSAYIQRARLPWDSVQIPPLQRASREEMLSLSFAQQRLWFLDQLEPGSSAYNIFSATRLTGPLNVTALERSFNEIVKRHEVLRTVFRTIDGKPLQKILPSMTIELPVLDLREYVANAERESEVRRLSIKEAQRPFDLVVGPLLRTTLLRLSEDESVLLLTIHHIVFDAWSKEILGRELSALYEAFSKGTSSPLKELLIQYADFATWQRQSLQAEILEKQLDYWKKQLENLPTLQLPTDRSRPGVQTFHGARQWFLLSKALSEALNNLSRQEGVSLFMTLLAAFQTLLHRYTAQNDIAIGCPITGRHRSELEGLIGFFINTLVLRAHVCQGLTFRELLAHVREVCLEAYANQDLPFEKLVEELRPKRDLSHNPLFQVSFSLHHTSRFSFELAGMISSDLEVDTGIARFDLHLLMMESASGLRGYGDYNSDLFDPDTITRMIHHFEVLLEAIVADPEQRVVNLPLLTHTERQQLLVEWNDTNIDYPRDRCVHELFEAQVERDPDGVAVISEDERLSYRQLNQRANQLANYLRKQGVGANSLVGICLERSLETIIAALAILKAGGAYVALDPEYPKERLAFMLEDAGVAVILTRRRLLKTLPEHPVRVCMDTNRQEIARENQENPRSKASAHDLAYVIYTSGSTGKPKGVAVPHRAVNRLVVNPDYVQLTSNDVMAQASSFSFDASTFEIWGALLHGARLVIIPKDIMLSPQALTAEIRKYGITVLFLTTALFNQLVDRIPAAFKNLNYLLFGGETADPRRVRQLLSDGPPRNLLHVYGPTETTTFATCYSVTQVAEDAVIVPIGRPIANTQIYLLDNFLHPLPVGVTGEIYIGGDGLAREYLKRPDLTAEKFIPNPFSDDPDARLYKTGDLARYLPDGNIEFVGRADGQVKVRGFRIEPKEIELVLCQHPAVHEAAVLTREDILEGKRLVAFVVPERHHSVGFPELRSFLDHRLPQFMVPSAFVLLDCLPLTSNGKLDHDALHSRLTDTPAATDFVAPRSFTEKRLAAIWAEVLGIDQVGIHNNFFDLGGHSLLAIKAIGQIERFIQVDVPVRCLFESPTVAQLAARIDAGQDESFHHKRRPGNQSYWVRLQSGQSQTSLFCFPYIGGFRNDLFRFANLARLVGPAYSFYGLQAGGVDGVSEPHRHVKDMVTEYIKEMKTLQPHGPYFLLGECFSGRLAYATAQQLRAQGENVAFLAFLDAKGPQQSLRRHLWRRLTGPLSYHIDRISELDLWNSFRARIAFHLEEVKRLNPRQELRYCLDKTRKAVRLLRYALSGHTHILAPLVTKADNAERQKSKHLARAQKVYWLALARYRGRPYAGRVTVFVNEELYGTDPTLRWTDLAAGGIEVHSIPGNHSTYITEHVQVVAKELRECLDRAVINNSFGQ